MAAERAGVSVSAWLNHAAENELAIEAGLDAVRAWEADHGELTAKELAAADKLLDRVLEGALDPLIDALAEADALEAGEDTDD